MYVHILHLQLDKPRKTPTSSDLSQYNSDDGTPQKGTKITSESMARKYLFGMNLSITTQILQNKKLCYVA